MAPAKTSKANLPVTVQREGVVWCSGQKHGNTNPVFLDAMEEPGKEMLGCGS